MSEDLSERLREVIDTEFACSTAKAAEAMGVTTKTLVDYLNGEISPRLEPFALLAKATGVSLSWLAIGEGPRKLWDKPAEPSALFTLSRRLALEIGSQPENLIDYRVKEDLPPGIRAGDVLAIDITKTQPEDGVFLLELEGEKVLRRVIQLKAGYLLTNELGVEQNVESFPAMGRVVGRFRRYAGGL